MPSPPRHAPPSGQPTSRQELLYNPNIPTPSHAERARTLAQQINSATLSTLACSPKGYPYGSLITYAMHGPNPVFLISQLAQHTQNLLQSSKASLLIAEAGQGNPLALGRITLLGDCTPVNSQDREEVKSLYLAKNSSAKFYVDFKDFEFWQLDVSSIRYIGGFGRMSWVELEDWQQATSDPVFHCATTIIDHMNKDHADAMVLLCKTMSQATTTQEATMVGVDRYGFEMSALTEDGPRPIRLAFEQIATTQKQVREQMVALVKKARALHNRK